MHSHEHVSKFYWKWITSCSFEWENLILRTILFKKTERVTLSQKQVVWCFGSPSENTCKYLDINLIFKLKFICKIVVSSFDNELFQPNRCKDSWTRTVILRIHHMVIVSHNLWIRVSTRKWFLYVILPEKLVLFPNVIIFRNYRSTNMNVEHISCSQRFVLFSSHNFCTFTVHL